FHLRNPTGDFRRTSDAAVYGCRFSSGAGCVMRMTQRFSGARFMPERPELIPLIAGLPETVPFVGPETQERARGRPFRARIGANESGFGPSPRVIAAMGEAAREMWKYCDPESYDLRSALATSLG